jgi:hypothetical protein
MTELFRKTAFEEKEFSPAMYFATEKRRVQAIDRKRKSLSLLKARFSAKQRRGMPNAQTHRDARLTSIATNV